MRASPSEPSPELPPAVRQARGAVVCYQLPPVWRACLQDLLGPDRPLLASQEEDHLQHRLEAVTELDLVVVYLPPKLERDRLRLVEELCATDPDTPILTVGESDDLEVHQHALMAGATDYVHDPRDRRALAQAVVRSWVQGSNCSEVPGDGRRVADYRAALHHLQRLPTLKESANLLIEEALERSDGVINRAAKLLGITPQAICNRRRRVRRRQGETGADSRPPEQA